MDKVNLAEKFDRFQQYWQPKIVGEVNGTHVKLVKLKGEFVWHHHENEDELFVVLAGELLIKLRDGRGPDAPHSEIRAGCHWRLVRQ